LARYGIDCESFFDYEPNYKGRMTFFSLEVLDELCGALELRDCSTSRVRTNVMTRNVDLAALIGKEFEAQGVRFLGMGECRPCYWMNQAIGPGAEEFLRGRGGLRAKILTDGILRSKALAAAKY